MISYNKDVERESVDLILNNQKLATLKFKYTIREHFIDKPVIKENDNDLLKKYEVEQLGPSQQEIDRLKELERLKYNF